MCVWDKQDIICQNFMCEKGWVYYYVVKFEDEQLIQYITLFYDLVFVVKLLKHELSYYVFTWFWICV